MTNITQEYSNTGKVEFSKSEPWYHLQTRALSRWFQPPTIRQLRFCLFLALLYIIPAFVIWVLQGEMLYRQFTIGAAFIVLTAHAIYRRRSWHEMGFRLDTLKPALLWFGGATVFFVFFMLIASNYHWLRVAAEPLAPDSKISLLLYYFFIVSTSQEFIFRGLLFAEMKRIGIRNTWGQVLISGVLFALVHLHYRDGLTVMITLGMGLIWGWLYARYPNWLAISLSHGILGCVALLTHIIP